MRTVGVVAAADEVELDDVLASMPLRVWRSDQVVALATHPSDPRQSRAASATEFLTTFTVTIPGVPHLDPGVLRLGAEGGREGVVAHDQLRAGLVGAGQRAVHRRCRGEARAERDT